MEIQLPLTVCVRFEERGQINLWYNTEKQPMKNKQPLCLHVVTNSGLNESNMNPKLLKTLNDIEGKIKR